METKRSRFIATPTGRPTRVTPKDIDVLTLLQRFRYLPSNYIAVLLGWTGEYYKDVLAKLRHEAGLIECPNVSWAAANARYRPAVYCLTRKGERLLKDRGLWVPHTKTVNDFNHELMVCLIRASFELGAKKLDLKIITADDILTHPSCPRERRYEANLWAVPVSFEFNKHRIAKTVETDGPFFGLARKDGTSLIFPGFEADRATEPLEPQNYERSGIQMKFVQLRAIASQKIYQTRYGLPNAIIPFITINETHKRALMRVLELLTNGKGSKLFIFKSIPNFAAFENFPPPTGHMIDQPWDRVGHEPYDIVKELKGGE